MKHVNRSRGMATTVVRGFQNQQQWTRATEDKPSAY